jgi:hypothetical protein
MEETAHQQSGIDDRIGSIHFHVHSTIGREIKWYLARIGEIVDLYSCSTDRTMLSTLISES